MFIPTKVLAAALFLVLMMTTPVRAGPIDDVKATVSNINAKINTVIGYVDDVPEFATKLKTSAKLLSGNMQALIDDAVRDLQDLSNSIVAEINADKDARDAFVNGAEGRAFRLRLINLLNEFEILFNNIAALAPASIPEVDFTVLIDLLEKAPVRLLWPLYKVASVFDFLSDDLLLQLRETNDALLVAIPLFNADLGQGPSLGFARSRAAVASPSWLSTSDLTAADVRSRKDEIGKKRRRVVGVLKKTGFVLTHVGKLETAISKFKPKIAKKGAVWGFVGVVISEERGEAIGGCLELAGDVLGKVADVVERRLNDEDAALDTQSLRLTIQGFVGSSTRVPLLYPDDSFEDGVDTYVYSDAELATWATLTRLNQLHGVVTAQADSAGDSSTGGGNLGGRRRRR